MEVEHTGAFCNHSEPILITRQTKDWIQAWVDIWIDVNRVTGTKIGCQCAGVVELKRIVLEDNYITTRRNNWLRDFDVGEGGDQRLCIARSHCHRSAIVGRTSFEKDQIASSEVNNSQAVRGGARPTVNVHSQAVDVRVRAQDVSPLNTNRVVASARFDGNSLNRARASVQGQRIRFGDSVDRLKQRHVCSLRDIDRVVAQCTSASSCPCVTQTSPAPVAAMVPVSPSQSA